jgi:prepilin-type N-terminal cleavage/methylation domain-containing protein
VRRSPAGLAGRGFTLPEVLATLVLIGIVLPVVMRGVSLAMAASSHARYVAQAASLAEAKLTELVTTGQWTLSGTSGDFGPEWPQYRWIDQVYGFEFGASEIVLQVFWTERGAEQSLNVATIVYENANSATGILP